MSNKTRRVICYITLTAFTNLTLQPVYAVYENQKQDSLEIKRFSSHFSPQENVRTGNTVVGPIRTTASHTASSFISPLSYLGKVAYSGIKYISQHPLQTLTLLLAAQTTASAAFNAPRQTSYQVGDEFQINQNNTSGGDSFVARLSNNNAFVTWSIGAMNVYGRVFSESGTAISNEFPINQNATSQQYQASVAGLFNGNAFVIWTGSQTGNENTYGRLFSENGTAISNEFLINQGTGSSQSDVVSLPNGNAFVTWTSGYAVRDVYGRLFSGSGAAISNEFLINQNATSLALLSPVTSSSNGNIFVAWNTQQTGDWDIHGRLFSENGVALTNEFLINQVTASNQLYPCVASLPNGYTFIGWQGGGVFGRIFSETGAAFTDEFQINQFTTPRELSVASLPNGNLFVAWQDDTIANVFGRVLSENGTALTEEFRLNQEDSASQSFPSVAGFPNGNVFVAWQGNQMGYSDIYGRVFTNETIYTLMLPPITETTSMTELTSLTGTTTSGVVTSGTTGFIGTTGAIELTQTTETTIETTEKFNTGSDNSGDSPVFIGLGITGGVGVLLAGVGTMGYYYYHKNKSNSSEHFELNPSNPFAPTSSGFTSHPTVQGTLTGKTYEIWKELSQEEADFVQPCIAKKIPSFDYENTISFFLGKGKFGITYVGSDSEKETLYAVKEVYGAKSVEESLREGNLQNNLKDILEIMPYLDYRRIDPKSPEDQPCLFQVMPLAYTNGAGYRHRLSTIKTEHPDLQKSLVIDTLHQLMKGLDYMHHQGIVHLDIKDDNILYMSDGTLKIADFGRAQELEGNDQITSTKLGDRRKYSPEILAFVRHLWALDGKPVGQGEKAPSFSGKAADTWASGLYTLELWLNKAPLSETVAPFHTKVTQWSNTSFEQVLQGIEPLQAESEGSFPGILRHVLAVDFQNRLTPKKAMENLSSLKMFSSQERAQAFKKLIDLHAIQPQGTDLSQSLNMYIPLTPRGENQNYNYQS